MTGFCRNNVKKVKPYGNKTMQNIKKIFAW